MEPRKQNFKKLALSELSFIIISENYSKEMQNKAYSEIKRRFSTNGCNYETFMDFDEDIIRERGQDISNYLICPNPSGQQLMETYFKYVHGREGLEHGYLLFSEVLLCNSDSQNSFFTKALRIELNNIKKRMKDSNLKVEDYEKLRVIYNLLSKRNSIKDEMFEEDSLINCVLDIIITQNSFMSPKRLNKMEKMANKMEGNTFNLSWIPAVAYSMVLNNDILDYLNMRKIANKDILRLHEQRKSIISSLYNDNIDYSSIISEYLILRKSRIHK